MSVDSAMPTPVAVSVPALITVTKAVAGHPTRTERLVGSNAEKSGSVPTFGRGGSRVPAPSVSAAALIGPHGGGGGGGLAGPRMLTPPNPTPPGTTTVETTAPDVVNGELMKAMFGLVPLPPARMASSSSELIAICRNAPNSGASVIFCTAEAAPNGAETVQTARPKE